MHYLPPYPDPGEFRNRWLHLALMLLFIALTMMISGCSAHWHLAKAYEKDPTLFKDTLSVNHDVMIPSVETSFDCAEILAGKVIDLQIPTTYTLPSGEIKKESIRLQLKKKDTDSTNVIQASIDCPDVEYVTEYIPAPYPVEVPPGKWTVIRKTWYWWVILSVWTMASLYRSFIRP
jgi:hypothetical protein